MVWKAKTTTIIPKYKIAIIYEKEENLTSMDLKWYTKKDLIEAYGWMKLADKYDYKIDYHWIKMCWNFDAYDIVVKYDDKRFD